VVTAAAELFAMQPLTLLLSFVAAAPDSVSSESNLEMLGVTQARFGKRPALGAASTEVMLDLPANSEFMREIAE
jgi:hypothetical protein